MSHIYVSEVTGEVASYSSFMKDSPFSHRDPYRYFGDDTHAANNFSRMIKDRNKAQNNTSSSSPNTSYNDGNNVSYNYRRMHCLYFLFIGWWLGTCLICMIFPLFIRGLVKKSFGYW